MTPQDNERIAHLWYEVMWSQQGKLLRMRALLFFTFATIR